MVAFASFTHAVVGSPLCTGAAVASVRTGVCKGSADHRWYTRELQVGRLRAACAVTAAGAIPDVGTAVLPLVTAAAVLWKIRYNTAISCRSLSGPRIHCVLWQLARRLRLLRCLLQHPPYKFGRRLVFTMLYCNVCCAVSETGLEAQSVWARRG